MEGFVVPSLFQVGKYIIYFLSNENGEPIYVYIREKCPTTNTTKVRITSTGGCILISYIFI